MSSPEGTAQILFHQTSGLYKPTSNTIIVADIDGPVRFAATSTFRLTEGLRIGSARGFDGVTFGIELSGDRVGTHADDSTAGGVAIGTVGSIALELFRKDDSEKPLSWSVNSHYVERAEVGISELFPVGGGPAVTIFPHPDITGSMIRPVLRGKDVFFDVGTLKMSGVLAYDAVRGSHVLIGRSGDLKEGDYHIGTDGVDLVWTHGVKKDESVGTESAYDESRVIMTSPYTTDPAELQPRAVRSDLAEWSISPFTVGCGFAASNVRSNGGIQIVRLSDGRLWQIGKDGDTWRRFGAVIGITCEDLFVEVSYGAFARFRLDSLGPGVPASLE